MQNELFPTCTERRVLNKGNVDNALAKQLSKQQVQVELVQGYGFFICVWLKLNPFYLSERT